MSNTKNLRWWIWALAAFFYFYEYLLRVSPNVMVPELMQSFDITAGELGILTASFLLIYAPMQIPVGLMMDRFGARKLLTFASLGCGIGTYFFALSNAVELAFIGRFIIGASASFAFVGMVYVCSHWFEKNKRAQLVGLANSISMLGAFAGGGPLSIMVQKLGWRTSLFIWGAVGFILAGLIYFTIRRDKEGQDDQAPEVETPNTLLEGLKIFFTSARNWINSIVALLSYTVTTAIGGLWGVPFIQTAYGVNKEVAGFAASMLFFGWMVGSPVIGFISDYINNRKWVISLGALATFLVFTPVVYFTHMSIATVYVLIFLTGFFSASQLLNFTFATEINPSRVKGSSVAITNFIVALGGMVVQPSIGFLLQSSSDEAQLSTADAYSILDYKHALTILPICLLLCWILSFFLPEKNRQEPAF